MNKVAAIFTLTLFHFAACGGNDAAPVALTELPHSYAEAVCQHAFDCCTEAELMEQLGSFDPVPTTVAECATAIQGIFSFEDEQAGIDAGTIVYDAAKAGECIDQFRNAACNEDFEDNECNPFVGQIALDGACESSGECVAGATCFEGACIDEATRGEACPAGFCNDNSVCDAGTCVAPPAIGQECPAFVCVEGAFCDSDVVPSVCTALRADGEACDGGYQCASGACDDGTLECAPASCDGN